MGLSDNLGCFLRGLCQENPKTFFGLLYLEGEGSNDYVASRVTYNGTIYSDTLGAWQLQCKPYPGCIYTCKIPLPPAPKA